MIKSMLGLLAVSAAFATMPAAAVTNLVPNGDFELGNTGFSSEYAYTPAGNSTQGQYTVRSNPYPWNGLFASAADHTTGSGLMFVGNGGPTIGQIVWQSSEIAIASATDYFFEAFVMNVCCAAPFPGNTAPILTFSISLDNGTPVELDTLTIPLDPAGVWHGLSTGFNSGGATTAVLRLVNANTAAAGNDFAVDDIFLGTSSTVIPVVPEPATWAMMIGGFALAGAAMRRRPAVARVA